MTIHMKAPLEIGISVKDVERAADFYEKALGMQRISEATLAADRAELAGFGPVAFRMVRMQTNHGERIKLLQPTPGPQGDPAAQSILGPAGIAYLTMAASS
mgnify:FL=1